MDESSEILLIRPPLIGAGFAACVLTVLNYLRYCEREGLVPVVQIDESCRSRFLEAHYGDNAWEQFFEPVGPWSSAELQRLLDGPDAAAYAARLRHVNDSLPDAIKADDDSIFTWTFGRWRTHPPDDLRGWFDEQRRKGRETVRRFVRVKPHVQEKVDLFVARDLQDAHVLGLHMRGTDLHYAPPVSPAEYFDPIDRYLGAHPDALLYLATDQVQYLDVVRRRYGDIVLSYDCLRSSTATAPFEMDEGSPYRKGEDVLIDILILSRCNHLIRGASNIPEMAIYFSDGLESLDLSLEKRFAFGQDYMGRWSSLAARPAWEMIGRTDLDEVHAASSAAGGAGRFGYEVRRALASVRRPWRRLRRAIRRARRASRLGRGREAQP